MTEGKDDAIRIGHMLDACRDALELAGSDRDAFMASKLMQYATVRALQILGDAAKVVSPDLKHRFEQGKRSGGSEPAPPPSADAYPVVLRG